MYKMLFAAMLLSSSVAFAEGPPAEGGPGGPDPAAMQQKFQEKKAQVSAKISERIAEMQKRKACVDGASTPETLKACFPDRGKFGKRRGGEHRPDANSQPRRLHDASSPTTKLNERVFCRTLTAGPRATGRPS